MALTQSARLPGPSWDEEVVPALRKRLETESRTLARRMSAISLSSADDSSSPSPPPDSTPRASSARTQEPARRYQPSNAGNTAMSSSSHHGVNGANSSKKPASPTFQRPRTYSQPYTPNMSNNNNNGALRPKAAATATGRSPDPSRSLSPRPSDVKPTRIPVASRPSLGGSYANGSSPSIPYTNGYPYPTSPEPTQPQTQNRTPIPAPKQPYRILNEPAPFQPSSAASSTYSHEAPPRPSNDSEERPFEHWYRGDTSRNGGVGELRVGRRQEMLEIANYGHTIGARAKASNAGVGGGMEAYQSRRKRADSIAGLTNKERERGSVYLDEERAREVGRVLDEGPLTDLDASEAESTSDYVLAQDGYSDPDDDDGEGEEDVKVEEEDPTPLPPTRSQTQLRQAYEARSATPTAFHRPSSRIQQHGTPVPAPTRIPGPSSRRSSESRVTTPTPGTRGQSEPPSFPSPGPSTSTSPTTPTASTSLQGKPKPKRGASPSTPTAKKSRTKAATATRAKTTAARREMEEEEKRRSVAYYSIPGEGGEDGGEGDMAYAIPSWTQPVPREGNWDDVVLPVVARKKGLDEQYEHADGSPRQQQKVKSVVEPAPGTFGYDHSKYRPPRANTTNGDEYIPMDEFGRPTTTIDEEPSTFPPLSTNNDASEHDKTRLPVRQSPEPFSQYAPPAVKGPVPVLGPRVGVDVEQGGQHKQEEQEEAKAGCCASCVIM